MKAPVRVAIAGCVLSVATILGGQAAAPVMNSRETDFANLTRYREADERIEETGDRVRVVFLGDSITEYWGSHSGHWFAHAGWVNRGVGGQTTSQLLLRERQDALALKSQAIVLEGGANDMRLGFSPEEIRDNLETMGELAEAHHVRVFLAEMTPVCDCVRPLTGLRTVERIAQLNGLIAKLCREKHWTLLAWNRRLADAHGLMRAELTVDGVHPNDAGYALLAPVIEDALRKYR